MIYIALFILLIAVIAIVTNQLNMKPACNHDWVDHHNSFKCCKCGKKIPDCTPANNEAYRPAYSEAA